MPKVRALVPLTDPKGNPIAAGQETNVDDETAANWRADGKVSLIEDEQKQAQQSGVYSARTGREDAEPLDPSAPQGGPQQEKPKAKK